MNYYNEIDPKAAAWLRELIKHGHIARGVVDERSIVDVRPDELMGYTQCHFFAGIGIWSYALRLSGWPDDRPVWTGSCPCQPFSAAGKGKGFEDERHLWPVWHNLIKECRPPVVFGEQVASKAGLEWFDLVSSDMEASGYAVGAADLCAAGVGAPHIRQRLWFVGMADSGRNERGGWNTLRAAEGEHGCAPCEGEGAGAERERPEHDAPVRGSGGGVADAESKRVYGINGRPQEPIPQERAEHDSGRAASGVADTEHAIGREVSEHRENGCNRPDGGWKEAYSLAGARREVCDRAGPTNSHWRDADWLFCRDGKWRPTIPSPFEVADGVTESVVPSGDPGSRFDYSREDGYALFSPLETKARARIMRLHGYGNGIVPQVAQAFIETVMEYGQE